MSDQNRNTPIDTDTELTVAKGEGGERDEWTRNESGIRRGEKAPEKGADSGPNDT